MSDTREFVEKVQDTQKKAKKNKENQGGGDPGGKLPHNSHHGTRNK